MIKINTLYDLYVYSINAKIQRHHDTINQYNMMSQELIPELKKYEPLISRFLNYAEVLNGKVKGFPKEVMAEATPEIRYANLAIKQYYELRAPMHNLADEIKTLSAKRVSLRIYKEVTKRCNNKIADWLLQTGKQFSSPFLGTFIITHREDTTKPHWGRSNKNKKAILDRGGIPYNHKDFLKAQELGIPYHGEKWLDTEHPNGLLYVSWKLTSHVKQHLHEKMGIKFHATKGNYGFVKKLSDHYLTNVDYSLYVKHDATVRYAKIQ